ncbi:mutY homolog (E. coli), isoform CRA_c [Rattus norvegicus]|uniref:MutY homolog (E. coli), isoform CRA_c n=1 Tax=Rattus norvegicus TaxID=10116 RepID=A6JZA9_RAT|nr:mutY homolog (E. coli), isoform CRA_c [Rattus norvegicus]
MGSFCRRCQPCLVPSPSIFVRCSACMRNIGKGPARVPKGPRCVLHQAGKNPAGDSKSWIVSFSVISPHTNPTVLPSDTLPFPTPSPV